MPRSREPFTPAMYEQNLVAIATISNQETFTDDDYAKLAQLDEEFWGIQDITDYNWKLDKQEQFEQKIMQRKFTYIH